MRILFISDSNPEDKKALSGIVYSAFRSLSESYKVEWIGANKFTTSQMLVFYFLKALSVVFRFKYPRINTKEYSRFYGANMQQAVDRKEHDIVFSCLASSLIANLTFQKPVIHFTDATFNLINGYYAKKAPLFLSKGCNSVESLALQKARNIIVTSTWARNDTINFYGIKPDKISVGSFGSNLEMNGAKEKVNKDECLQLVFVGVDWERKGGELAYSLFVELLRREVDCYLTIVGCSPGISPHKNLTIVPFLDKNQQDDYNKLVSIWQRSHFLVLPTKADCTPIVFSEAASFGVPVLSTDTGGVNSVIRTGINGFTFPTSSGYMDYADKIQQIWNDKHLYLSYSNSSYQEYKDRLNWKTWTNKISLVIETI